MNKKCLYCHKEISIEKYRYFSKTTKKHYYQKQNYIRAKFCDNNCSGRYYAKQYKGIMPQKGCTVCSKLYSKRPKYSNAQWKLNKYCSNKCQSINRSKQVKLQCVECKKDFYVLNYLSNTRKHCSKLCKLTWTTKNSKTTYNELIRKRIQPSWRKKVFERDNYTCQICKQVGNKLNADHIIPFSILLDKGDFKMLNNIDNGRTLCVPCHRKTDTYGLRKKKVADQWLEVING